MAWVAVFECECSRRKRECTANQCLGSPRWCGRARGFFGRRRAAIQQAQQENQQANRRRQQNQQQQNQPAQGSQPGGPVPTLAEPRASVQVTGAPATAAVLPADIEQAKTLPTPEMLAKMDTKQLEAALRDVSSRLHVRLANLQTAEGWQRYLRIPGVLLDAPHQNAETLQETIAKFDSVCLVTLDLPKSLDCQVLLPRGATLRQLAENSARTTIE